MFVVWAVGFWLGALGVAAAPVRDTVLEVFEPVPSEARPEAVSTASGAVRRWLRLRDDVRVAGVRPGDRWRLPLPDGGEVVLRHDGASLVEGGVSLLRGTIEGEPGSEVRLAGHGEALTGTIRRRDGRVFRLEPRGGRWHAVQGWVEEAGSECANGPGRGGLALPAGPDQRALAARGNAGAVAGAAVLATGTGTSTAVEPVTIDVAFLYTRAAEAGAGGSEGMSTLLALAVAEANETYQRSEVRLRLRLVCQVRSDYEESGNLGTDLSRLLEANDGWLDEAQTLRNRHAADVVCLVVEWEGSNQYAGMANQLRDTSATSLAQGYTACLRPYLVGNYSLPHEVGHLLGCDHDRDNSVSGGLQTWSYGTRILVEGQQYRTVMAYRPGRQMPHFSNPNVRFRGVPTGVADGRNAADNVRTMNYTASMIAGVREPGSRVGFDRGDLRVVESAGVVTLVLERVGTLDAARVDVATVALSAVEGRDYVPLRRTVELPAGIRSVEVALEVLNNAEPDGSRRLAVALDAPSTGLALGPIPILNVVLIDDEDEGAAPLDSRFRPTPGADYLVGALLADPQGRLVGGGAFATVDGVVHRRLARWLPDGRVDPGFVPDVKYRVHALSRFPDGRLALGGDFNTVNDQRLNHVAILRADGTLDPVFTFDPGSDYPVYAVLALGDGRLIAGGAFTNVQNQVAIRVVRLLASGQPDPAFQCRTGPDDEVLALGLDAQGKILVGGKFRQVAGRPRAGVARLSATGELDSGFADGTSADGAVRALAPDSEGRVVVAGEFTRFQGPTAGHVVRLTSDGLRDANFLIGSGADDTVSAVVVQPDGRIWIAGRFRQVDGRARRGVARLCPDGSLDPEFDPGSGPDDSVLALALRPEGGVWIGGAFTEVNGTPRAAVSALLPAAPAVPHFTDWAARPDGFEWRAGVAAGQTYRLERSSDCRDWRDAGDLRGGGAEVGGRLEWGTDASGYLRLRRKLE